METVINSYTKALSEKHAQGFPIEGNIIDYLYQQGYMQDSEYQKFYMDKTRMFVPKLQMADNNDLADDLDQMCTRMETVERTKRLVFEAKQQQDMMEGFF